MGWPIVELSMLLLIAGISFVMRKSNLEDHWTSCRLAAEQLRLARLCLLLFVIPTALRDADIPRQNALAFTVRALNEVKRAVRDQGLPRSPPDFTVARGVAWLDLIVADQAAYHENNYHRLAQTEKSLGKWGSYYFVLGVLAVLAHFFREMPALLILAAAGPAFAAALHDVGARLGIAYRIVLSRETGAELVSIHETLRQFDTTLPLEKAWPALRALALRASNAMGNESTSWHSLARREKDNV
jgi:hypothetical protein